MPWRLVQDWDKEGLQGGSGSSGSHAGSSGSHGGAAPVALALGPKKNIYQGEFRGLQSRMSSCSWGALEKWALGLELTGARMRAARSLFLIILLCRGGELD